MALTVTSRGTGTHNTGATTLVPDGRSATLAVGSMGVLAIAVDNAGASGSAVCAPTSWTDAKGNVWTRRINALYDNGTTSAGIEMAFYTAPITVALLTTDAGTMTWISGVSPVAKAWTWYEVIPSGSNTIDYGTGGNIAGATAANATVVTGTIEIGDAVIAGYFSENVATVTGDSDTTNGTWTAQQTTTIGTTTGGVRIATQQKVQTTAASTQSYDVTVASQDRIAGWVTFLEHQMKTGTESGTGSDTGSVAIPIVGTESGTASDASTSLAAVTGTSTESGIATDASVRVAQTGTAESGTATDAAHIDLTTTEAGTGSDLSGPLGVHPTDESGTATDASVRIALTGSAEQGVASDLSDTSGTTALLDGTAESGTGNDLVTLVDTGSYQVAGSDAGEATDAMVDSVAAYLLAEVSTGSEVITDRKFASTPESGVGAETSGTAVSLLRSDSGTSSP